MRKWRGMRLGLLLGIALSAGTFSVAATEVPAASPAPAVSPLPSGSEGFLNKLLAPGKLIRGHKDLEGTQCLKCHSAGSGVPDSKCLDCHKDINRQVIKHTGYHGLMVKTCVRCHNDHKGRNYDSTWIDPKKFDHKETGFTLIGKHRGLDCEKCHATKRGEGGRDVVRAGDIRYLGPTSTCVSCHKKDDPHQFKDEWAKKDCNACHGESSWTRNVTFDHEKDADYKLEGSHAKLKCAVCHVPKKGGPSKYTWDDLDTDKCMACHIDQHKDNLSEQFQGGDCTRCHTQIHWSIKRFNHAITGYPLRGKHATTACVLCHTQTTLPATRASMKSPRFKFTGLSRECASCHADYHGFAGLKSDRLGALSACQNCHTESHWIPSHSFDHDNDTIFPISGKHRTTRCFQCHILQSNAEYQAAQIKEPARLALVAVQGKVGRGSAPRVYHWSKLAEKTCESCHASPHLKTFTPELLAKKCTDCHTDEGWKILGKKRKFDHDRQTRFPLTGKHKGLGCIDCHRSGKAEIYKFAHPESGFCVDCHTNVHIGQFDSRFAAKACTECHTTANFAQRRAFRHEETDFKLTGQHTSLTCEQCHKSTQKLMAADAVIAYGRADQGPRASRKPAHFASQYLFAGKDRQFCESCHTNVHLGQFSSSFSSRACVTCHTTTDFVRRLPFQHATSGFRLKGRHAEIRCSSCHVPTRALFPAYGTRQPHHKARFDFGGAKENDCARCHKDPHQGAFGKACMECHTEKSWKQTRDFHKNFTLTGVHNSLSCDECHRDQRILAGQSQNCILCHQKNDIHNHLLPDCGSCHRQDMWEHTNFQHSMTQFPLRGAHRTLSCMACHNNNIYRGLPDTCVDCHQALALTVTSPINHRLLVGRQCSECHNEFSFSAH